MIDTRISNPSIIADLILKAVVGIEVADEATVEELVKFFSRYGQEYDEVISNFIIHIAEIANA